MKFGKRGEEAENDPRNSSGGGSFIRYMKDGDTKFRVLEEPDKWITFWEHFNPGGFSFPCTGEKDTCPGCTSQIEKMKKPSKKIAFNVLEGEYVNVYAVPPLLSDKLKLRYERLTTITDRDYLVTRYKTGTGDRKKTEYDVEGMPPTEIDVSKYADQIKDVEPLLEAAYNESWGDSEKVKATKAKAAQAAQEQELADKVKAADAAQPEKPPFREPSAEQSTQAEGEVEVTEEELRAMSLSDLVALMQKENITAPNLKTVDEIVDWLLTQQQ